MAKDGLKEAAIMYGVEMLETVASRYIRYVHDSQLETVLVLRMLPRSSWCFSFAGHDTVIQFGCLPHMNPKKPDISKRSRAG